jgi:formiminoglutamase
MTPYFHQYKKTNIDALIRFRTGETKLGELVAVPEEMSLYSFLEKTTASFIVVGIAEDIGVLANHGNPGADTAWNSFLPSFLNIQANDFTAAHTIAVIGYLSFDELKEEIKKKTVTQEAKINAYRNAVTVIDDAVDELIRLIVSHQKLPIIIGGGHNNSYPIIKGTATALALTEPMYSKGVHCVNLDAHLDYRLPEGRHSGNGFRYAKQAGFLLRYFALGIHENYIPDGVLKEVSETKDVVFITYEDVFIRQSKTWRQALEEAGKFTEHNYFTGIELDLDSIEYFPSSAATPCGVTSREALQYIDYMASHCKPAYLHICEGIASKDDGLVGKLISYVVSNFVKTYFLRSRE